jgi:hypothetical protein
MERVELAVDVTEAAGLGEPLSTRVTVVLPDPATLGDPPVVCFGFPGGGYCRRYFTFALPGSPRALAEGQAGWHARRGWVFVACDHLSVGDSDMPSDPTRLSFEVLAAVNHATAGHVAGLLRDGALAPGFPALREPVLLGLGQSMGGGFTIVQQGRHATFDGIAVLGFSGRQVVLWMPPGTADDGAVFLPRGSSVPVITQADVGTHASALGAPPGELPAATPGFHYDDVPREVVERDMVDYPTRRGPMPEWGTASVPPVAATMTSPGVVAPEAAVVAVPVFVGTGERDVVPDPRSEPRAYPRSRDVTVYVCPRMAHMHNFAGTRERMWTRIHSWGEGVARQAGVA